MRYNPTEEELALMTPQRRFYYKNRDAKFKAHKEWWHANKNNLSFKEKRRWYSIKTKFGITKEQYQAILDAQNNCCAICQRHKDEFKKPLYVDHDHSTGVVRGLLCCNCNTFLGAIKDTVEFIDKAKEYVSRGIRF